MLSDTSFRSVHIILSLPCGEQKRQNPPREVLETTIGDFSGAFRVIALAEDFKTINGKEYKNVTVSRVEPDGIVLKSKSGITKVYFTELPKDVQKRFQHDSAQGAHFTADKGNRAQQNAAFAEHRLGGTADQFAAGMERHKIRPVSTRISPLLEGAIHHSYAYRRLANPRRISRTGWSCRSNGVSKIIKAGVNATIQDYELQAIMTANTPAGATWKEIMYNNPDSPNKGLSKIFEGYFAGVLGEKMWQRSDGAILWLRNKLIVRLELPAAHEYEMKLKAEKEQKARESVPQF